MDLVTSLAGALQGQLATSLLAFGAAVVADLVLGVLVAGLITKDFTIRKLADFWVTTVGYQKLVAFAAAVVVMFIHGDPVTRAIVATMAFFYATSILPDIYDKLSALIFGGKLPLSTSLAPDPAKSPR